MDSPIGEKKHFRNWADEVDEEDGECSSCAVIPATHDATLACTSSSSCKQRVAQPDLFELASHATSS
jgi:hypothetical protein